MISYPITIGNKHLKVHFEETRFIDEVLLNREYDALLGNLIVVDVGCNIGTFTLSIYDKIRQAYCLDISRECIDLLNLTIEDNGLSNIKAMHLGLGSSRGRRGITKDGTPYSGAYRLFPVGSDVDVIDIETLMHEEHMDYIDLLKIDIEGGEYEVFESQSFKNVAPLIHTIIGEYHNGSPAPLLRAAGYRYNELGPANHYYAKRCL